MEDKIFRLEEMKDSMKESVANGRKVAEQNEELLKILREVNSDKLGTFVEDSEKQLETLKKSLDELDKRIETLEKVLEYCENEDIKIAINTLIEALGIFNK